MKLQFNTVECNIKKLKEELKIYNEACKRNDDLLCRQSMERICTITMDLRESIRKGHWYSHQLKLLNGTAYQNPAKFYIEFNSIY